MHVRQNSIVILLRNRVSRTRSKSYPLVKICSHKECVILLLSLSLLEKRFLFQFFLEEVFLVEIFILEWTFSGRSSVLRQTWRGRKWHFAGIAGRRGPEFRRLGRLFRVGFGSLAALSLDGSGERGVLHGLAGAKKGGVRLAFKDLFSKRFVVEPDGVIRKSTEHNASGEEVIAVQPGDGVFQLALSKWFRFIRTIGKF